MKNKNISIPLVRPCFGKEEAEAAYDVIITGNVTRGKKISEFEQKVAKYCNAKHAVAVCNGSAALQLAVLAIIGLGPGKRCWVPCNTFVATANCALLAGVEVDFVDIDPENGNLSISDLKDKLIRAEKENKIPDLFIPVHFAGQPCDMKEIAELARKYDFSVIEDAAQALGAYYNNEPIGSCTHSELTVFSFHPAKTISTGEGGMVLTSDTGLYEKLLMLRHNGITSSEKYLNDNPGTWYYEQLLLSSNFWITDIQAAIGIVQMEKIKMLIEKRKNLDFLYRELIKDLPVHPLTQLPSRKSSYHLFVITINNGIDMPDRNSILLSLKSKGVSAQVHYIPLPNHPFYKRLGKDPDSYPGSQSYYKRAISLPLYPDMTEDMVKYTVDILSDCF